MKRFLSLLLVFVLLISLAVPAFASVPAVSAIVAVGAQNEPVEGDILSVPAVGVVDETAIIEPFSSDFSDTIPVMGELAAVSAETSFSPVYSPESYLIQSLMGYNISIEDLRPIVKQYKYCQILYNQKMKKILLIALYSSLSLNDGSLFKPENDRFEVLSSKDSPINIISFRYDGSFEQNILKFGSYPIYEDSMPYAGLDAFPNDSGNTHLYSFNFNYVYNGQKKRISSTSPNSIVTYAQTGVIPVEPPITPPENPFPDLGGGDNTNGFIGEYGVKVLLPRNDFKQSKLNTIATKIYYKIPYNGTMTDVKIKVGGYTGDRQDVTYHKVQELSDKTVLEGYLDVVGAVSWNKETSITVTITDYTGKSYNCAVDVICYDDFVDEDKDGKDDRTDQDEWTGSPDFNKPIYPDNSFPEGGNVIDWFKWFFNQSNEFSNTVESGFNSVSDYGSSFAGFFGSVFPYLPSEIPIIIGLGFAALVFLRVFGR